MPKHDLFLLVDYDVIKSKACFSTNIQQEKVADVIVNFLRTQIGAGRDTSEANILDLYEVDLRPIYRYIFSIIKLRKSWFKRRYITSSVHKTENCTKRQLIF